MKPRIYWGLAYINRTRKNNGYRIVFKNYLKHSGEGIRLSSTLAASGSTWGRAVRTWKVGSSTVRRRESGRKLDRFRSC